MSIFLLALIAAVIAQVFGWLWHGPLFGKKWCLATGGTLPAKGEKSKMPKSFWISLIINFIANYVMAFATYLIFANLGAANILQAFILAAVLFVGFALPLQTTAVIWNGRPGKDQVKMFFISFGYQIINFALWAVLFGLLA